jgi:hypothetical protein
MKEKIKLTPEQKKIANKIVDILKELTPEEQVRILKTLQIFYDLDLSNNDQHFELP